MSNSLIAFFLALGAIVLSFTRFQKTSGGNTSRSVAAVAIIGLITFGVSLSILDLILK